MDRQVPLHDEDRLGFPPPQCLRVHHRAPVPGLHQHIGAFYLGLLKSFNLSHLVLSFVIRESCLWYSDDRVLLAGDLSTGSVGADFEYETPDIAVYINYFGISTMAGMGKVLTTDFMSSAFGGGVLGVSVRACSAVGACLALSLLQQF